MTRQHPAALNRVGKIFRRSHVACRSARALLLLAVFLAGGIPFVAYAAVPVWVVQIDAGTDYERSLERFLFDLFNTLQRRQEDFTAAFELQKIEKAREDVNKLFQETQEELRNFGYAFDLPDQRLSAQDGTDPNGEPPLISPIRGGRILNDPLEYLNGEPATVARMVSACSLNYVIWDQEGRDLFAGTPDPGGYADWNALLIQLGNEQSKCTYGRAPGTENDLECSDEDTEISINNVRKLRNTILTYLYYGHPYSGANENTLGPEDPTFGSLFFDGIYTDRRPFEHSPDYERVKSLCDGIMAVYRVDTPATAALQVAHVARATDPKPTLNEAERIVRNILAFPVLIRNLVGSSNVTLEEMDAAFAEKTPNTLEGLTSATITKAAGAADAIAKLHELNYIVGQGIRPENLYLENTAQLAGGIEAKLNVNTEYVISPAVVLLQKMQAATQATFDLAGQGFLYLDADQTPTDILGRYNLVSTLNQQDERSVCNNLGQCLLLDPWLKPAADFRSAPDARLIGTSAGATPGSGLPAPFEDEGAYISLGNEKAGEVTGLGDFRYTIDRFRVAQNQGDNIRNKVLGRDYAINDWYDRVLEMYEPNRGGDRAFTIGDWQCYIATWFANKNPGYINPGEPTLYTPLDEFGGRFADYCSERLGDRSY
ncbi:MAG: hypothetical protein HY475_02420 [Candidatus Terrybacteria bacterium]|nr:hypothetical protein [Candidatus Terrybacteria bacterium]